MAEPGTPATVATINRDCVWGISSRFNADDTVRGWRETTEAVAQARVASAAFLLLALSSRLDSGSACW
jgi:hypothetical protein